MELVEGHYSARSQGTFKVESAGSFPLVHFDTASVPAVGQAEAALLAEPFRVLGAERERSHALSPWWKPLAVHDPATTVCVIQRSASPSAETVRPPISLSSELGLACSAKWPGTRQCRG